MNGFTKLFLVVLRLAIGWHLLFEGVVKVRTHELGKTTTNTPFSSTPHLRDASGPLAAYFHQQPGDLDEEAQAKLGMLPEGSGDPNAGIPKALESDWDAYLQRWTTYYQVSDDQERQANEVLAKAKERAAAWLQGR